MERLSFSCLSEANTGHHPIPSFSPIQNLLWLLRETFEPEQTRQNASFLVDILAKGHDGLVGQIVEVGPRLSFSTAYSSNAVGIWDLVWA